MNSLHDEFVVSLAKRGLTGYPGQVVAMDDRLDSGVYFNMSYHLWFFQEDTFRLESWMS